MNGIAETGVVVSLSENAVITVQNRPYTSVAAIGAPTALHHYRAAESPYDPVVAEKYRAERKARKAAAFARRQPHWGYIKRVIHDEIEFRVFTNADNAVADYAAAKRDFLAISRLLKIPAGRDPAEMLSAECTEIAERQLAFYRWHSK